MTATIGRYMPQTVTTTTTTTTSTTNLSSLLLWTRDDGVVDELLSSTLGYYDNYTAGVGGGGAISTTAGSPDTFINKTTQPYNPNFTNINYTSPGDDSKNNEIIISNPAVGVLLVFFSFVVVVGNIMVIVAVFKEMYLRTVTNYFIVSLAIADVMVGGIVMPFSISNEMTDSVWLYGQAWCDLWRSLDVLASTASILNLCVISVDRYWAITDPIAYPSRMSNYKVCILIALVWFCSAGISFPAIVWWRAVQPSDVSSTNKCQFTEDSAYLIISSVVSFYIPTVIMIFVYFKIYRAAHAQTEGIKSGSKVASDCPRGDNGEVMTLRIHRGGVRLQDEFTPMSPSSTTFEHQHSSDSESQIPYTPVHHQNHHHQVYGNNNSNHNSSHPSNHHHHPHHHHHHRHHNHHPHHHHSQNQQRSTTFITKKIRHFAISKKITKLAREQKAAKTIGIVVGVFIICWVPFFCANVLLGICNTSCVQNPAILMPVFTWLGYINSGMNPIIYALSMRDFRRAFSKMIFCCPRYRNSRAKRYMYHHTNSLSTSTFSVNYGDRCVAMKI